MTHQPSIQMAIAALFVATLMMTGCKQEQRGTPRPPAATATPTAQTIAPQESPQPGQMKEVDTAQVVFSGKPLVLTGVSFNVPQGWVKQEPKMNPGMITASRKAQFRLPKADIEPEDAEVAVTHFPGMAGMDEANLQRWYRQFSQPDGRPTASVAIKATYQIGQVAVTLVDIPGTLNAPSPMMGGGQAKENYRMLAAIVNHPKGPHFIKLTGPAAGLERWKPSFVAFLKSVTINK